MRFPTPSSVGLGNDGGYEKQKQEDFYFPSAICSRPHQERELSGASHGNERAKDRTYFLSHVPRHSQEGGTTELGIY